MLKLLKRKVFVVFVAMILISDLLQGTSVKAETKTPAYSIVTVQDKLSGDNGTTIAIISYKKLVLEGKSQTIKKINQSIKNDCIKIFKENKDRLFEYAQIDYDNGKVFDSAYFSKYSCEVTYLDNNTISLKMTSDWYAGGVRNKSSYGLNYSLITGKKLSLTDVLKGSSSTIKSKIIAATTSYLKKLSDQSWSEEEIKNSIDKIKKYNLSDFKFYLKGNYVYLCYDEYELIGNYYGGNIVKIKR